MPRDALRCQEKMRKNLGYLEPAAVRAYKGGLERLSDSLDFLHESCGIGLCCYLQDAF